MRNVFIFLFLFIALNVKAQGDLSFVNYSHTSTSVYSAATEMNDVQKAYKQTPYWKKYRVLNGFGFGALGVGICGMGVGIIGGLASGMSDYGSTDFPGEAVFLTSLGLTLSSIPLFIFANKNKKKAKRAVELSLNTSHMYVSLPNGRQQSNPALGLCINF